jgi:ABC-type arginine transport system ATPase subunit
VSDNPFPGPQPYRASDRDCFFGREDMAYTLETAILAGRCIAAYGPSGAGKSSLVQAAVIPKLVEAHEISVVRVDSWPLGEAPARWLSSAMYGDLSAREHR